MAKVLNVKSVHDYNAYIGQADGHPLVSVIHYDELPPIRHSRTLFDVYALFLRDDRLESLSYGCSKYDYKEGTLICVAPGQVGGVEDNGETFRVKGWALLFHPLLLKNSFLEDAMAQFSFFEYSVNEALHLSEEERELVVRLFSMLRDELRCPSSKAILLAYVSLILEYCMKYYDRQFATRFPAGNDILVRFNRVLQDYYGQGRQLVDGLPTVAYCAGELCMSPNYFGDLIRKHLGISPNEYIQNFVLASAKNKLYDEQSISEVAYALGFDYPQHFSRWFKKQTGLSPLHYRLSIGG